MSNSPDTRCAACGRSEREAGGGLVTAVLPPLCGACIQRYTEAQAELKDAQSRRRGTVSASAAAEELALNLMDRLESSRAGGAAAVAATVAASTEDEAAEAPRVPPKVVAVIPSRYGSVRLPAKPLALIAGKPLVQHVWERCVESGAFAEVIVATDDLRIVEAVQKFGGTAVMTSQFNKSGTDRVAEVARLRPELTHFVNVQGDEPLVAPDMLQSLAGAFEDPEVQMVTLVRPLEEEERPNPNIVKVVLTRTGDALYFSRADIPFQRDPGQGFPHRFAHLGLYGYTRETLLQLARLPASPLEDTEKLEQLRALECGMKIRCLMTLQGTIAVDTAEDVLKVEAELARRARV